MLKLLLNNINAILFSQSFGGLGFLILLKYLKFYLIRKKQKIILTIFNNK